MWNLKETAGIIPSRRTETAYNAGKIGQGCHTSHIPIQPKARVILPKRVAVKAERVRDLMVVDNGMGEQAL